MESVSEEDGKVSGGVPAADGEVGADGVEVDDGGVVAGGVAVGAGDDGERGAVAPHGGALDDAVAVLGDAEAVVAAVVAAVDVVDAVHERVAREAGAVGLVAVEEEERVVHVVAAGVAAGLAERGRAVRARGVAPREARAADALAEVRAEDAAVDDLAAEALAVVVRRERPRAHDDAAAGRRVAREHAAKARAARKARAAADPHEHGVVAPEVLEADERLVRLEVVHVAAAHRAPDLRAHVQRALLRRRAQHQELPVAPPVLERRRAHRAVQQRHRRPRRLVRVLRPRVRRQPADQRRRRLKRLPAARQHPHPADVPHRLVHLRKRPLQLLPQLLRRLRARRAHKHVPQLRVLLRLAKLAVRVLRLPHRHNTVVFVRLARADVKRQPLLLVRKRRIQSVQRLRSRLFHYPLQRVKTLIYHSFRFLLHVT